MGMKEQAFIRCRSCGKQEPLVPIDSIKQFRPPDGWKRLEGWFVCPSCIKTKLGL
jgi:hypothetical protein